MSMTNHPFTITNESISVVWDGKPYTIRRGAPQFEGLRKAILAEDWASIPNNLTVAGTVEDWAKGDFKYNGTDIKYKGSILPKNINKRILEMVSKGEDPAPFGKFWERLQKNPSYRSVNQLWDFMQHEGIPLTKEGRFLAYKSVKGDYKDHHSGTLDNHPGVTNEMPRNQISDDPDHACHEGLHVGALAYVQRTYSSGHVVVVEVDPEHVVCVPKDSSQHKMRVCKYKVIGNHNGEKLPDTTYTPDDADAAEDAHEADLDEAEGISTDDVKTKKEPKKKVGKKFAKFDAMSMSELMTLSLDELRQYAGKGVMITGASKIPGGKTALVTKILQVRSTND